MDWSSLLGLKAHLRASRTAMREDQLMSGRVRSAGAIGVGSIPASSARLAIGAIQTSVPNQYRLALRPMDLSPATRALIGVAQALAPRETEVVEIGPVRAVRPTGQRSDYSDRARPIRPGYSIGQGTATGTLGGFVERQGRQFMLSNRHVLVPTTQPTVPVEILQPGPGDGGRSPRDAIGELAHIAPFGTQPTDGCDAALATFDRAAGAEAYYPRKIVGVLGGLPPLNSRVWKVGRTTGFTWGVVTAVSMDDISINYDDGVIRTFDDQIEVEGLDGPFSRGGDSGSLIVTENGYVVAQLFAGSDRGGRNGGGRTFGTPFNRVLAILNAKLIC